MPFTPVYRLKIRFFLVLLIGYCGFAQTVTQQNQNISQRMPNNDIELSFCDEDNDGFMTFNIEGLKEQAIQIAGLENDYFLEQIVVSSNIGVYAINNPSTDPQVSIICSYESAFDIAVDSQQNLYLTGLYRLNDDCTGYYYGVDSWQVNASSFDDLDNLYLGKGNQSYVLKYTNITENSYNYAGIWHDFETGTSGGDFVLYNEKMYVAWKLGTGNYRLYEVTVDADRNYISHIDLGQLPDKTYGLAKEYGKIYGITPNKLYQIHLDDFTFTDIITNNDPIIEWYGAAGLHEAVNFETSLHLSLDEADNNTNELLGEWTNTILGGQTIYLRIENTLTGSYDIVNVTLIINDYPLVNTPLDLESCFTDTYNSFDLNEVSNQMQIDSEQNLEFTYYTSDPQTDDFGIPIPLNYQTESISKLIFVKVENLDGGCFLVYDFLLINNEAPNILPLSTPQEPTELTSCYLDSSISGYFDLTEIENDIVLENGDFDISYYLNFDDAQANTNQVSNIYYLESPSQEIFVRVTDENQCFSISNFFIDYDCIRNNPSTDFIIFPKFITPNNDTVNDYWNVKGISEKLMKESTISIFNRYGKLLVSFKPNSIIGWDGTVNGILMPTSDYWVVFKTNSGFRKTGHFTLKR